MGITQYRCKYCNEIDDEQNIQDHMKCASRFMFEEITTNQYKLYFKPVVIEEQNETRVRALYDDHLYSTHKPEIDRVESYNEK